MKKILGATLLAVLVLTGCGEEQPQVQEVVVETVEPNYYTMSGHYYDEGYVCDEFGEAWNYEWVDCEYPIYDGMPVKMIMSDNGTDLLYDDEVLALEYDEM